ncbi:MAG: 50S ribosomal protein L10 [Planctomycetes bacterium]|nr:50S ribosomal protein L10 [Planctomycetota bacterium]
MSKRLKVLIAKELESDFRGLDRCVILGLTGIPAVAADHIRAELASKNARLQVVKNTLAAIALKEAGLVGVDEYIDGPSAVVTGGDGLLELVKAAAEIAKVQEGFELKGGWGEGKVLSPADVRELSNIPGRPQLLASLASAMESKMVSFAGALGAVQRKFLYALGALESRKA